jgi:transcription elongation factor GreA
MNTLSTTSVDNGLLITATGYEDLRAELETLRGGIAPGLSERLREARQDGHLADNPPLFDLLQEQAQLDQRISLLEARLAAAQIAAPATDGRAGIGSRVRVRDLEAGNIVQYELVGAIEPKVGNGRVSVAAPVGRPSSASALAPGSTLQPPAANFPSRSSVFDQRTCSHERGKPYETRSSGTSPRVGSGTGSRLGMAFSARLPHACPSATAAWTLNACSARVADWFCYRT